jgi:hypothetical protein
MKLVMGVYEEYQQKNAGEREAGSEVTEGGG